MKRAGEGGKELFQILDDPEFTLDVVKDHRIAFRDILRDRDITVPGAGEELQVAVFAEICRQSRMFKRAGENFFPFQEHT